ncbi:hypothetical protein K0U83_03215 [bacterium]|nr:hypothetical protein [bacterium]
MIIVGGPTQQIDVSDGTGARPYEEVAADIPHTDVDYTAQGIVLPDGRVAVVMVLDDRGDGVPADSSNTNGSTIAAQVRAAYNAARGV